jgi:hypothetical protein
VRWDQHFALADQESTILPDGRVRVTTRRYYTDLSQRKDFTSTDYFVRESALGSAQDGAAGPSTAAATSKGIDPAFARWAGKWTNVNPNTSGITKLQVESVQSQVMVHMWGRCQPTDCDWGSSPARLANGILEVHWDHHFALRDQELAITSGRLRVTTRTHYTDLSQRQDFTETDYFAHE